MRDLRGKTAFITGAASGIGFGLAQAFAEAGMQLAITDIDEASLARAAATLRESGATVFAHRLNIADRAEWTQAADAAQSACGSIDILCNNAGITAMGWEVDQIPPDLWDLGIGINLTGAFNGTREIAPRIKAQGTGGHIVFTASVSALRGRAGHAVYVAAKHGILGLADSLRGELAPHHIGVSVLAPGHVHTALHETSARVRAAITDATGPGGEDTNINAPSALDPLALGRFTREAVETDRFFILSHAEFRGIVEDRHTAMMDAFDIAETFRTP